jgi:hypothetical protein
MKALLSRVNIYTLLILSKVDTSWARAACDPSVWRARLISWHRLEPLVGSIFTPVALEELAFCVLVITTSNRRSNGVLRRIFARPWRNSPSLLKQRLVDLGITNEQFLQLWSALQGHKDVCGARVWIQKLSY